MKLTLKDRIKFLFRKRYSNKCKLSTRGNYMVYYLIRKYINEEKIDTIQAYEEQVDNCLKEINEMKFFETVTKEKPEYPDTPEIRRVFAATLVINIILKTAIPEDKEKILSYISEEKYKKDILEIQQKSDWIKFI